LATCVLRDSSTKLPVLLPARGLDALQSLGVIPVADANSFGEVKYAVPEH